MLHPEHRTRRLRFWEGVWHRRGPLLDCRMCAVQGPTRVFAGLVGSFLRMRAMEVGGHAFLCSHPPHIPLTARALGLGSACSAALLPCCVHSCSLVRCLLCLCWGRAEVCAEGGNGERAEMQKQISLVRVRLLLGGQEQGQRGSACSTWYGSGVFSDRRARALLCLAPLSRSRYRVKQVLFHLSFDPRAQKLFQHKNSLEIENPGNMGRS